MEIIVKKQLQSQKYWQDEKGLSIPSNRLSQLELLKEKESFDLLSAAAKMNTQLVNFKNKFAEVCQKVLEQASKENEVKNTGKGNFTWYNFDGSIKVEVRINNIRSFDDLTIMAAKAKLEECIKIEGGGTSEWLQGLIVDVFGKKNGKLDVDKVLSLKKHKERTTNKLFHEAMDLIDKSIRVTSSKTYYSISQRNAEGQYEPVLLDFAAINITPKDK